MDRRMHSKLLLGVLLGLCCAGGPVPQAAGRAPAVRPASPSTARRAVPLGHTCPVPAWWSPHTSPPTSAS